MKKFLSLILILLRLTCLSQSASIDSIRLLLKEGNKDSTQVLLLAGFSLSMHWSNPDSAYALALEGIKLSRQIGFDKGETWCKISAAACSWSLGNYALSIELLLPTIAAAEKTKDINLLLHIYSNLHNAYRDQGDYHEALKYNRKISQLMPAPTKIDKATEAFIYLLMGRKDSMEYFIQNALQYPPSFHDGWIYSVAGRIYADQKKYASAFLYYRFSIPTLINENNQKDLAWTYNNISSLFKTTGQLDSALVYVKKSLAVSAEGKFAREAMESNLLLAELYESKKSDSALYYFKKAITARDSLYNQEKQKQILGYKFREELYKQEAEAEKKQKENSVKQYFLSGLVIFFLAIAFLLFRNNRHKQKAREKIEKAYADLKLTQAQLVQSEKMASLGELTAGIAHEIQNPLNFVNNFSDVNKELVDELQQQLTNGKIDDAIAISNDIKENEEKINHHGKRADTIVKGMLQHSHLGKGVKEPADINKLADEYLRLAYQGLRAKDKTFNAVIRTDFDQSIGRVDIIPQDIGRVVLNLVNNALYIVYEKKKKQPVDYEPTIWVSTKKVHGKVEIAVKDNGTGIPQQWVDKIFQPFFTTKPTGQGTGLGLSLAYDIIKAHGGEIRVDTNGMEGVTFVIQLPQN